MLLHSAPAAAAESAPAAGTSQQTPGLLGGAAAEPVQPMVPLSALGGAAAGVAADRGQLSQLPEQSDAFFTAREGGTLATGAADMGVTPLTTAASRPKAALAGGELAAAAIGAAAVSAAIMAAGAPEAPAATDAPPAAAAEAAAAAATEAAPALGPTAEVAAQPVPAPAAASPSQAESEVSFAFHKQPQRDGAPTSVRSGRSGAPTPALAGAAAAAAAGSAPSAATASDATSPAGSAGRSGLLPEGPAMQEGTGFADYGFDDPLAAAGVDEAAAPRVDWSGKSQEEIVSGWTRVDPGAWHVAVKLCGGSRRGRVAARCCLPLPRSSPPCPLFTCRLCSPVRSFARRRRAPCRNWSSGWMAC